MKHPKHLMPQTIIEQALEFMPLRFGSTFDVDITLPEQVKPDLAIRWAGYQELTNTDPPNVHDQYPYAYVVIVLGGHAIFSCAGESWEVKAGSVYWARDGLDTKIELVKKSPPLSHYVVMAFGDETEKYYETAFGKMFGASQVLDPVSFASLFEVILDEACGLTSRREENCVDLFKILLHRVETQLIRDSRGLGSTARETYHRAHQYLQKNYANILDLGDVAKYVGVSVPYLCRLYEKYAETTAFGLLSHLKLTKAERLLCASKLKISEISKAVGYSEQYIFSRNFRKKYNLSPSSYRKKHRRDSEETD